MEPHRFAVMLVIETTDPRLSATAIDEAMGSARGISKLRRALLQRLPADVRRLAAVFPVEHAKLLMQLHEAIGDEIAAELNAEPMPVRRAPSDYVPPSQE